jgi:hypothetical protein
MFISGTERLTSGKNIFYFFRRSAVVINPWKVVKCTIKLSSAPPKFSKIFPCLGSSIKQRNIQKIEK